MRLRTLITSFAIFVAFASPIAVSALTSEEIQAQINTLLTQIRNLRTQIADVEQNQENQSSQPTQSKRYRLCSMLQQSISEGEEGDRVRALQEFLISEKFLAANATGFFGSLTREALARWQERLGLIQHGEGRALGSGVFGPRSRAMFEKLCQGVDLGQNAGDESLTLSNYTSTTTSASNQPPTINSFDGPATLAVNKTGSWKVNATDPEGQALKYHVAWGDVSSTFDTLLALADLGGFTSATTFTHAYNSTGLYQVTIRVGDGQGGVSSVTTYVRVESPQSATLPGLSSWVAETATGSEGNSSTGTGTFGSIAEQCTASIHSIWSCLQNPVRKCNYNGQEYTENQTRSAGLCLGFGVGFLEGPANPNGCLETTYVCRTGVWLKYKPKLASCNMGGQMYPHGTTQDINPEGAASVFGGPIGTSTCVDGVWISHFTVNQFNGNSAYTSKSCKYSGTTYSDGDKAPCTGVIGNPNGQYSSCAPSEDAEWAFDNVCRNGEWKQETAESGGGGATTVVGNSCTTPWGGQTIASSGTISKEPYFTNGGFTGTTLVPKMKCNNGSWLQCDHVGNACQAI
jgi:hypothetical protein